LPSGRLTVPRLPETPEPAVGVVPAATVSGIQTAVQPPVQ
jgi:hypothetical protein